MTRRPGSASWSFALACALGFSAGPTASAEPILVTITGGTFSDGGTITGTLTLNPDTDSVTNYSISVAGGNTAEFSPFTYTSADSAYENGGTANGHQVFAFNSDASGASERFLFIAFSPNFTDAGGSSSLYVDPNSTEETTDNFLDYRNIAGGSAIGNIPAVVPEPSSFVMAGIGAMMWLGRRRMVFSPR